MESGKFRKKRKNFAQVSNTALMDKNLSMKAKGLFAMIESFIAIPDFVLYKQTLINSCKEGRDSFNAAWNELKNAGYLKQYRVQGTDGLFSYEYELLDDPAADDDNNKNETDQKEVKDAPTGDGFSVYGLSVDGLSGDGKPVCINNINKNNIKLNNININNNISNNNENNINNSNNQSDEQSVVDVKQKNELILEADKLAKEKLLANKSYIVTDDPVVQSYSKTDQEYLKYAKEFGELYAGPTTHCYYYELSDLINNFVLYSLAFRNTENSRKAKELMDEVLASFSSPKEMLAILKFSPKTINDIYLCSLKILEGNSGVADKKAYLAQIVRSMIAQNKVAERGGS